MKKINKINVEIEVSNMDSKYCGEFIHKEGQSVGCITPLIEIEKECKFKQWWGERGISTHSLNRDWWFVCKLYYKKNSPTIIMDGKLEGKFHAKRCNQCIKDFGL